MSSKLERINKQLKAVEDQRKELLMRKKKEEEKRLLEIGNRIAEEVNIETIDLTLLMDVIKEYYIPLAGKNDEDETDYEEKTDKKL